MGFSRSLSCGDQVKHAGSVLAASPLSTPLLSLQPSPLQGSSVIEFDLIHLLLCLRYCACNTTGLCSRIKRENLDQKHDSQVSCLCFLLSLLPQAKLLSCGNSLKRSSPTHQTTKHVGKPQSCEHSLLIPRTDGSLQQVTINKKHWH